MVDGDVVQYWPPATTNVSVHGVTAPQTVNSSASSTAVINGRFIVATREWYTHRETGTTFTSPTIYISYDTLYASDSCSQVGSAYSNLVVPITQTDKMSSLIFKYGWFTYSTGWSTAPFHVSDLVPPVAKSIYNLQPACMSQYELMTLEAPQIQNLPPDQFNCNAGPYSPIIAVPEEVSTLDPEWSACLPW
jgi:hypothetical protein